MLVAIEPTSYLDFGMKLLNLERRREHYGAEHSGNIDDIYKTEVEIKTTITKQDAAPHRSRDKIMADIKKYHDEYEQIKTRQFGTTNSFATFSEWFRATENSTSVWRNIAKKNQLTEIKSRIAILKEELIRE